MRKWAIQYYKSRCTVATKYIKATTAAEAIKKARCKYIIHLAPVAEV
jgi:hypothetical protein